MGSLYNCEFYRNFVIGDEGLLDIIWKYGSCGILRDKSGGSYI